MTADQFRRLAHSLPGVSERAHMDHPDFRVGGKIFATLGYPDVGWGMLKLNAQQQREFIAQKDLARLSDRNNQSSTLRLQRHKVEPEHQICGDAAEQFRIDTLLQ